MPASPRSRACGQAVMLCSRAPPPPLPPRVNKSFPSHPPNPQSMKRYQSIVHDPAVPRTQHPHPNKGLRLQLHGLHAVVAGLPTPVNQGPEERDADQAKGAPHEGDFPPALVLDVPAHEGRRTRGGVGGGARGGLSPARRDATLWARPPLGGWMGVRGGGGVCARDCHGLRRGARACEGVLKMA